MLVADNFNKTCNYAVACFVFTEREKNKLALSKLASEQASKYSGGYEGGLTSDRCRREPIDRRKLLQRGAFLKFLL